MMNLSQFKELRGYRTYHPVSTAQGNYTILYVDAEGETWDINTEGETIKTLAELREFVQELFSQRALNRQQFLELQDGIADLT
jgi:hypothetical protein